MGLQPLGDRVLVEPLEEIERVEGGIVLPESAVEKPTEGEVLAVGAGAVNEKSGKRSEMPVSVGDVVIYGKYAGMEIKDGSKELKILSLSDILAVRE